MNNRTHTESRDSRPNGARRNALGVLLDMLAGDPFGIDAAVRGLTWPVEVVVEVDEGVHELGPWERDVMADLAYGRDA